MKKVTQYVLFGLLLGALFGTRVEAQVINAASCNQADVQAAFNAVTASTTTINIPAGTCVWTSQAILYVPTGSSTLSILGAGNITSSTWGAGGGDATVITDNDSTDSNSLVIVYGTLLGQYFRVAGITFQVGTGTYKDNGTLALNGYSQTVRIDHMHFKTTSTNTVEVRINNWEYGVVDHCFFDGDAAVVVQMDSYGNPTGKGNYPFYGDGAWYDSTHFGTGNAVYIENNVATFGSFVTAGGSIDDCQLGGTIVIRYNTITYGSTQTHPTGGNGRGRGCRREEIYGNNFNLGSGTGSSYNVFYDSSGTALIWGNTAQQAFNNFITLHNELENTATYTQTAVPNGWGYCGTGSGLSGDGSAWGYSTTSASGEPCLDQPGRGKSDMLEGTFPNVCDVTTGCTTYNGTWPNQLLEPVYEWMDTWTPISGQAQTIFSLSGSTLVENQDYYGQCGSLSATCTGSFTGAKGTGYGLLSARPSTCTPGPSGSQYAGPTGSPGVAYWATDTNTLYVCTATNTWTAYYTPYSCPHPLDVGGTCSATADPGPSGPGIPPGVTATVQ